MLEYEIIIISKLTDRIGKKTVTMDPNDFDLVKFYEGVEECLRQIAGISEEDTPIDN